MKKIVAGIFFLISIVGQVRTFEQDVIAQNKSVYFVILAGGTGERLWPLSKKNLPKQLLNVEQDSFLTQAIMRIAPLAELSDTIWVVTSENHAESIKQSVGNLIGTTLIEPDARNTGPAILYTCLKIHAIDPNATVVFLPADAFIDSRDNTQFAAAVSHAVDFAQSHKAIAILGLAPTYAATGYGYIEFDNNRRDHKTGLHKVKKFHEKPNAKTAQEYISKPSMLWNVGIMCAQVQHLLEHFKMYAPQLCGQMDSFQAGDMHYAEIKSVPVEPAIIEPSEDVWVLPSSFSWCDVGNMNVFLTLKDQFAGLGRNCIEINAHNNLVDVPGKLVGLIGVSDLCVVQTDNELLIVKRSEAEKVKLIVQELKERGATHHL